MAPKRRLRSRPAIVFKFYLLRISPGLSVHAELLDGRTVLLRDFRLETPEIIERGQPFIYEVNIADPENLEFSRISSLRFKRLNSQWVGSEIGKVTFFDLGDLYIRLFERVRTS